MLNKLSAEALDALRDLLKHEGVKALLFEIDNLTLNIEQDVLKLYLDGSNEKELLIRKARAEGARRLYDAIRNRLQSLKSLKKD